jgi:hypothetical protein
LFQDRVVQAEGFPPAAGASEAAPCIHLQDIEKGFSNGDRKVFQPAALRIEAKLKDFGMWFCCFARKWGIRDGRSLSQKVIEVGGIRAELFDRF